MSRHGRRLVRYAVLSVVVLLLAGLAFVVIPARSTLSVAHPAPLANFSDATLRIAALNDPGAALLPECRTRFLSHGARTDRVVVFFHGYTSCPEQFTQLAAMLFDAGANVLIAPLPLHGMPDRMTPIHAHLTAAQLVAHADSVIDIAGGLGDHVTVAGLSAGGLLAGWAAQNRDDVDLAVLISPVFGYAVLPSALTLAAARVFALMPDKFEWWDNALRENAGPHYAYPRYSRRALAHLLKLSAAVLGDARRSAPLARRIVVVTNASDVLISNERTRLVVERWRRTSGAGRVVTWEFPAELELGHDLIDPAQPNQNTTVVYGKLMELMEAR